MGRIHRRRLNQVGALPLEIVNREPSNYMYSGQRRRLPGTQSAQRRGPNIQTPQCGGRSTVRTYKTRRSNRLKIDAALKRKLNATVPMVRNIKAKYDLAKLLPA